jgi:hypothetical protein
MATYRITIDRPLERVPNRDAQAITVRVHRDDTDLGLYQAWVTGPEWVGFENLDAPTTGRQFARLLVEQLARKVRELAINGDIRAAWQQDVDVVPIDVDAAAAAVKSLTHSVLRRRGPHLRGLTGAVPARPRRRRRDARRAEDDLREQVRLLLEEAP